MFFHYCNILSCLHYAYVLCFKNTERATDASMPDEDWALNMEICDLINEQDDGPRDAVRAIKKRLQLNAGKNNTVVLHTLIVCLYSNV